MKTTRVPKVLDEVTQLNILSQNGCHEVLPKPFMDTFYPNECFLCKTTKNLHRCRRCQMICYCGKIHQKEHWEKHKEICKIIAGLLKQQGISHLYENLRGVDQRRWIEERKNACMQVEMQLSRPFFRSEMQMLRYPRVCFVCYEAKQQNLTNCPSCPAVSFCSRHRNTNSHTTNCVRLKICHDLDVGFHEPNSLKAVEVAHLIVDRIFFYSENQTLPKSLKQLMTHYPKPPVEESVNIKIYCSDLLTNFLTVFNALQKLHLSSVSKLLIHFDAIRTQPTDFVLWEILLHLLPNLKFLKVVILNSKETLKNEQNLCNKCKQHNKHFELETLTLSYGEYLKDSSFEMPNILVSFNINPSNASKFHDELWKSSLLAWGSLSCPLVLTTRTDAKSKEIAQILTSTFPESKLCYEALNEFASLRPKREWELGETFKDNQFMTIVEIFHKYDNVKTPSLANGIIKKSNSVKNKIEKKPDSVAKKIDETDFDPYNVASTSKSVNFTIEKNNSVSQHKNEKNSELVLNKVEDELNSDNVRVKSDFVQNSSLNNKNESPISDEDVNQLEFFYVNSCQVCHSTHRVIPCNRCKMISYCGENHRKEHWPKHKNLCKVILKILNETGRTSLFDKLGTRNSDSWARVKIDMMWKVQRNLGRQLENYEQQMFLFPKTCFDCHETDWSMLKTCVCGVSLCKHHKKDPIHENFCNDFQRAFKNLLMLQKFKVKPITMIANQRSTKISIKSVTIQTEAKKLPNTITEFMDSCMSISRKVSELFSGGTDIFSELLSRPLTLIYGIQMLNLTTASSLTIHVIGATNEEFSCVGYWEIILHWLPKLKEIKVVFVGPEINGDSQTTLTACVSCSFVSKKPALVFSRRSRYSEYFESKSFSKPDVIIGYNLDLHDSELGISECTWKESMLTLKKLYAPFILTAGSEDRAKKDHKRFHDLMEKSVPYYCCEVNPFASLIPERDFESEELKYTNKYIVIYKGLSECPEEIGKLKTNPVEKIPVAIKDSELQTKVIAAEIEENKKKPVDNFPSTSKASLMNFEHSESTVEPSSTIGENPRPLHEDLLHENLFLREENHQLKEENSKIKDEIQIIRQENERLRIENRVIKDIRSQVHDSIRTVMREIAS